MTEGRPVYRFRLLSMGTIWLLGSGWLAAWTLRAVSPERAAPGTPRTTHYLPIPGESLFTLRRAEGTLDTYLVAATRPCTDDAGNPAERLGHDDVMSCPSGRGAVRMRMNTAGSQHGLVLDGFSVSVPASAVDEELAVVGLGRGADVVLPLPGIGARHIRLMGPGACAVPAGDVDPEPVLACVLNGGLRDSLVVDSSRRLVSQADPKGASAPLLRRAPGHDEAWPLRSGDWLWAGQIPLVVQRSRVDRGVTTIEFRIPHAGSDAEDWREASGDRRWMGMELPEWSLGRLVETDAGWVGEGPDEFEFLSREVLFGTSFLPLPWETHLDDRRVEWQEEEQLQQLIDHELLCLESEFDPASPPAPHAPFPARLGWNLVSGQGCDGRPIPPPPVELFRMAGERAHDRETNARLEFAARLLWSLPDEVPNPSELGFVFDWARYEGAEGELAVVPVRLLGVRPLSTQNGPSNEPVGEELEDECDLAKSDWAKPPISVRKGSTSPYFRVVSSGRLGADTRLLLLSGGSVCVGATIPDSRSHPALKPEAVSSNDGSVLLGHLGVSIKDAQWSALGPLESTVTTCALLDETKEGWRLRRSGASGDLVVLGPGTPQSGPALASMSVGAERLLRNGESIRLVSGGAELELAFVREENRDLVAYTQLDEETIRRRYPFGEDLAAFLGVEGKVWGGIEGWFDPEVLRESRERWRSSCGKDRSAEAIELTLAGDLERIVYGEVAAVQRRQQQKATARTRNQDGDLEAHEVVRIQAVLMDGNSGALLAVVNTPSFDPEDETELRRLQDSLKRRDGRWQAPARMENLAFRRNSNVGSVYKLVTSYAMARAGLFEQEGPVPAPDQPRPACWRMGFRESTSTGNQVTTRPPQDETPKEGERVRCAASVEGTQVLGLGAPSAGFEEAFRESHNTYFSLATLALAPRSGVRFQLTPSPTLEPGRAQVHQRVGALGAIQELVFAPGFKVSSDLGRGNAFFDTLVAVGHRFHYGSRLKTQWVDEVNGTRFPSAGDKRWLPGLQVGGFWYPSVTGPELYDMERSERAVTVRTKRGVDENLYVRTVPANHVADYAKIGYGMGGIESSALALAVVGTPMVAGGAVIAPDLLASDEGPRVMTSGLISAEHRDRLERAMKAVVREGSASSVFTAAASKWPGLGAKTGTFDTNARPVPDPQALTSALAALARVTAYGCGEVGATFARGDWESIRPYSGIHVSRAYVPAAVDRVLNEGFVPPRGFGAGAARCQEDNPNRVGVSADLGPAGTPIDGGTWLDALHLSTSGPVVQTVLVPGSSLISIQFEGMVPGSDDGAGWILAVVSDGRDNARGIPHSTAKLASRAVWTRLRQYFELKRSKGGTP